MESSYWQRYWQAEARRRARRSKPKPRGWRPSTIGKGESTMNYWQRQDLHRTQRRGARRRAA